MNKMRHRQQTLDTRYRTKTNKGVVRVARNIFNIFCLSCFSFLLINGELGLVLGFDPRSDKVTNYETGILLLPWPVLEGFGAHLFSVKPAMCCSVLEHLRVNNSIAGPIGNN